MDFTEYMAPSKHETLTQRCANVGSSSTTRTNIKKALAQRLLFAGYTVDLSVIWCITSCIIAESGWNRHDMNRDHVFIASKHTFVDYYNPLPPPPPFKMR